MRSLNLSRTAILRSLNVEQNPALVSSIAADDVEHLHLPGQLEPQPLPFAPAVWPLFTGILNLPLIAYSLVHLPKLMAA